jgi:5-methylcytosine-specific restriction protein B
LILRAIGDSDRPYFLILDEMNLSHVERYFADFLSVMESKGKINLHSSESCDYPPQEIGIPENLFIIGTVNIDETTYMFSPKVLDRANTIEFRVTTDEMSSFLKQDGSVDMSKLKSKGANMAKDFVVRSKSKNGEVDEEVNNVLLAFFEVLQKAGAEFGYRTANEIRILITQLKSLDASLKPHQKLDIAIMQKLLPKLHGSRRKLEDNLRALCTLCLEAKETVNVEDYLTGKIKDLQPDKVLYPISMEKIQRMYRSSVDHGFASYAEA